jgi:hypothetical protein
MLESPNDGKDWGSPVVRYNPVGQDVRDPGVIWWSEKKDVLTTWFTADGRTRSHEYIFIPKKDRAMYWRGMIYQQPVQGQYYLREGFLIKTIRKSWLCTPHGPIEKWDGGLIYMGRCSEGVGVAEYRHRPWVGEEEPPDEWEKLAIVPLPEGAKSETVHEPHIIQTGEETFLGVIRFQKENNPRGYDDEFSMYQTVSKDGGKKWSTPKKLFDGSPPHLMRHSRGTIVLSYGQRKEPYGIRVALSDDNGKSWQNDLTLWDKGVDTDLGYPASVELKDGSILTIFYGKLEEGDKCGILGIRWKMPA